MSEQVDVTDHRGNTVENDAQILARSHTVTKTNAANIAIYDNLALVSGWLDEVRRYCQNPDPNDERAADWLLDNDYHIARALRNLKLDLPPIFYDKLPALVEQPDGSIPRVFALANAMTKSAHSQLNMEAIVKFVSGYQEVSKLTNAELWALPSMLQLNSIEHLIDAFHQLNETLKPSFKVSRFAIEGRKREPIDRIATCITNIIAVYSIKWTDFVDRASSAEAILKNDPASIYSSMTSETRIQYRSAIEDLADRSKFSESDIANAVVGLAAKQNSTSPENHVGYWLVDAGRNSLESVIGYKQSVREWFETKVKKYSQPLYAAAIIMGLVLALLIPVDRFLSSNATVWQWIGGILLTFLPATFLSVTLVHWLVGLITRPQTLPELDFKQAINSEFPTAIVIPVILGSVAEVDSFMESLEVRWLSNTDSMLRFVVLSDLMDSQSQNESGDTELERSLAAHIVRLNKRYPKYRDGPFFLMHRSRTYNATEQCWMGWERKRGKLSQFNKFVLGDAHGSFSKVSDNCEKLRGTRFAIVLDADTQLPPGSAARLVGMMAHPLNTAQVDSRDGRVKSGYTILQPRIEILPEQGSGTLFSHMYSGDTAIDIYSRAVSDVYQDLFGTGIFVGKGIYDIAAFEQTISGRAPENAILSHDLFEGIHGRTALASNVVLYEDFPKTYQQYAMRLHRWVRGDWQLLPWLAWQVPGENKQLLENRLSLLDRWKILDNLRRSLTPPALLLFFIGGWMLLPGSAVLWTLLALAAPGGYLIGEIYAMFTGGIRQGFINDALHRFSERGGRWFLAIAFLVSDTLISLDAIFRTLWRLLFTQQNLLEWKSAAHATADLSHGNIRLSAWRLMWPSSVFAGLLAINFAIYDSATLLPAAPILALWLFAPEIAVFGARARQVRQQSLDDDQQTFLRHIARRTWHFFESFAGPADNWLPPDNYQEEPNGKIAHRTSPTNIGMLLVSALSAKDFGFITTCDFLIRSRNALDTMDRMKSHRGHLLNWYDTNTLAPLEPQYVSTVDSGNLAVALIALKNGCLEDHRNSAIDPECWQGLADTFDLLMAAIRRLPDHDADTTDHFASQFEDQISEAAKFPAKWVQVLDQLSGSTWMEFERSIASSLEKTDDIQPELLHEIHTWLDRFHHHLRAMRRDLNHYFPWQAILTDPPIGMKKFAKEWELSLSEGLPLTQSIKASGDCLVKLRTIVSAGDLPSEAEEWLARLETELEKGRERQSEILEDLHKIAQRADQLAFGMDFSFLYDPTVRLFVVGHNISSGKRDTSHYDLLATEARLASFFALAKQDAPIEHWYFLGRPITRLGGKPSVLSWNGSMFEYLMPPIFLPTMRDTLLGESEITAVEYQARYAKQRGVPWGISESAFGVTDSDGNYQYRAFGVPGLGLRRGLTDDLVIAPYASALALCVWPVNAVANMRKLKELGSVTTFGFWEALDFTPGRAPEARAFLPVKTYMTHHQGMILAAITNVLKGDVLVERTLREKSLKTLNLLLQERVPWEVPVEKGRIEERWEHYEEENAISIPPPWIPSPQSSIPQMHVLGNGRLSAIVSESGGGGISWKGNAITRWLPDPTRDCHGYWLYVQDKKNGDLWSVGRQPLGIRAGGMGDDTVQTIFHQHMVEFFRQWDNVSVRMETTIAPFDDVEVRRITMTNEGKTARILDVTSYAEVVLAPSQDDERHPAFSKLFVGSTHLPQHEGLLFERRPRRPETQPPVLLHRLVSQDSSVKLESYETDRANFLGRNRSSKSPIGLENGLSREVGWTLDPVMALQARALLESGETKQFYFVTAVGDSRAHVIQLSEKFSTVALDRVFRDAALEAARKVHRQDIDQARLPQMQVLSSHLMQPSATLRFEQDSNEVSSIGQPDLWRFGISGDLPLLVLVMKDTVEAGLLNVLIKAQRIWHENGLQLDLVILRAGLAGYEEPLRERILSILRDTHAEGFLGRRNGIHLLSDDQMDDPQRKALLAAAHIVLSEDDADLGEMLDRMLVQREPGPIFEPNSDVRYGSTPKLEKPDDLLFDNTYGGFDARIGEYVINLQAGQDTPAPWCNILANAAFGTIVSEAGLGFTWATNSGEFRLTPWSNDPVTNTPGEVLYLRDEITGQKWTVSPTPIGDNFDCQIQHGKGYTRWKQNSHDFEHEMLVFVPPEDTVKLVRMRLKNSSTENRRITATYYAEWILGALGSAAKPHVICNYDTTTQSIIASNSWNPEFEGRIAFLTASKKPHSISGDRHDFLGREGDLSSPAGIRQWDLGGRFTTGGDNCAAYQVYVDIAPGETQDIIFVLGEAQNADQLNDLTKRWQDPKEFDLAFQELANFWRSRLGAVQVKTPDPAFDLMVNQWLPYQNMSSRLLARAGFYQAGGAFGCRDQLQDSLAFLLSDPGKVRNHILYAAGSQFEEGDALHWWHPPAGRGVRTRCSDDYIWLVYVTAEYVRATGDKKILDVEVQFLSGEELSPEEGDRYASFGKGEHATLFEHCSRALDRMMVIGRHGLPLMGTGDWNDGMDRIGDEGRGESIWLAWFQIATIKLFSPIARRYGFADRAERWTAHALKLEKAIEQNAWDGQWFIRAFDDEGKPWGSYTNVECQIDSISQSWSVLSGVSVSERTKTAMESAYERLVHEDDRLVQLLDPPFWKSERDPGYIQAYPPGIRENGGQYTHAAAWLGFAFAKLGDGDRAWKIFDIINPIRRTSDKEAADHYLREPYVLPGDVSGGEAKMGQGGWSWYTGSASWTWKLAVEGIFGVDVSGAYLRINPAIPKNWGQARIEIQNARGQVSIDIQDPDHVGCGVLRVMVDGKVVKGTSVRFPGKGKSRNVVVRLGKKS
jgi:cyclic beta-1,2-glucan synthetase